MTSLSLPELAKIARDAACGLGGPNFVDEAEVEEAATFDSEPTYRFNLAVDMSKAAQASPVGRRN